jgi:NAD(P)-dependent dehydrogenase (short-subunit alcohol dehydrogenase family)
MDSPASPRVALVTGGGRGIGRAIALALARAGHRVAIGARTLAEVEAVAEEIATTGVPALPLSLDVTDPLLVTVAYAAVQAQLGPVSVLVNNAGIAPSMRFLDTDLETWERALKINATGAFLCSQGALPNMLEAGFGRIVNIASTAARIGYRYTAAYSASKHALLGLTRALAHETLGTGITVNAVCPAFARTAMTEEASRLIAQKTGRSPAEALSALAALNPQGQLIEPEEVARAVVFLAADESRNITGQAVNVDGGAVMS